MTLDNFLVVPSFLSCLNHWLKFFFEQTHTISEHCCTKIFLIIISCHFHLITLFFGIKNYVIENLQKKRYKSTNYICINCSAWTAEDAGFPHDLLKNIEKNDESTKKLCQQKWKYCLKILWNLIFCF
jgi:hypothetical protein